jgi:hypothetical protein
LTTIPVRKYAPAFLSFLKEKVTMADCSKKSNCSKIIILVAVVAAIVAAFLLLRKPEVAPTDAGTVNTESPAAAPAEGNTQGSETAPVEAPAEPAAPAETAPNAGETEQPTQGVPGQ